MTEQPGTDDATTTWDHERPRLAAIATRMLGDAHEADDVVQETWLRLGRTDAATIDNLPAWLTTVASRICLDRLRGRTTRPEAAWQDDAAGGWASDEPSPEEEVEIADAVGRAMSVVLDSLAPAERLAYVLHDVFALPFELVSSVLGRSEVATRKLASRARGRLTAPETPDETPAAETDVVEAFMRASRENDFDALLELLDPDAVVRADEAAAAIGANPVFASGGRTIAEVFAGRARGALPAVLDGHPAAVWQHRGEVKMIFGFTVENGRVVEIEFLADPAVLARLG